VRAYPSMKRLTGGDSSKPTVVTGTGPASTRPLSGETTEGIDDDDRASADARDMFVVHTRFRREFDLTPGLVRAVAAGDCTRAAIVADHIAMSDGLAARHQGEDDQLWPRLRKRCPDKCAPLVDVMEDHRHHAIHEHLEQLRKAARS
jgi:hypothetical protein